VRRFLPRLYACWALVAALGVHGVARADEGSYSSYEQETIEIALKEAPGQIDPNPSGKIIEGIEIVTLEVIEQRDPAPRFLNIFHAKTLPSVVRAELLFDEGQRYDAARVAESARNLRKRRQLSLVLIVPLRGSRPDRVRMLIITKDVWSLRLNTDFQFYQGKLLRLLLQPAEENMFGTHKLAGGLFILEPATYSVGGQYIDRRVAGSRIQATVSANLIVNRDTGHPEGSFGTLYYGQPLFSAETKWAWKAQIVWYDEIFRSFVGTGLRTYDSPTTPGDDAIAYRYDAARWFGVYALTRSFGRRMKYDVSMGVEIDRRNFAPRDVGNAPAVAIDDFIRTRLPVSDTRVSPFLQLRSYMSEYHRVLDLETLGLQEDYRLGHEAVARVYPASKAVASSRDLLGLYTALGYTVPLGDGLARALVAHQVEKSAPEETDATVQTNARVVTPRLGFGRLVYDALLIDHYRNYLNERFTLGGDSRLRGYPPAAFIGRDVVASNLEYRTRGWQLLSVELGGALFYDVGDAFDSFGELRLKQAAGLGFRAVFPQAQRLAFRADWGFPLVEGRPVMPGAFFVTFGQAFDMPTLPPPTLESQYTE
jgi:hypothetical protein